MKKIVCFVLCLCMGTILSMRAAIPLELVNNSNTPDNKIYWCILGAAGAGTGYTGQLCYVNPAGQLVPAKLEDNVISKGNSTYPNYFYKLSENPPTSLPPMYGARMFISKGEMMYLRVMGGETLGYAGPNLLNNTDPNIGIPFEFIEFTCGANDYHGNTTRVDWFFFPISMRLEGNNYDKIIGEYASREEIFTRFAELAPAEFQNCIKGDIIFAPGKANGFPKETFFDAYMNHIWEKYKTEDMIFGSDLGRLRGRIQSDGRLVFKRDSDGAEAWIMRKPKTIEILEGSGALADGKRGNTIQDVNSLDLAVQAQFCAAANRHVLENGRWDDPNVYYQTYPYNFYASFWHLEGISYGRKGYGFCYDDVFDQSTLLEYGNATNPAKKLTVYIEGGGSNDPTGGNTGGPGGPGEVGNANVGGSLPCSGTEMTINGQLEYSYNFERLSNTSVKITIKALTSKTGLVLQGLHKNFGSTSETYTTNNATLSGTFNGVEGDNITIQVKWAWAGADDFSKEFVYKIGSGCMTTGIQQFEEPAPVTVYYDSNGNTLAVNLTAPADALQIYAIDGRLIYSDSSPFQTKTLSCNNWDPGVYVVKIRQNNQWVVRKFCM